MVMDAKNWYARCGDAIRKEFGDDADLFIDILASTSPRKQISANWRLAMRIYHVWQSWPIFLRYDVKKCIKFIGTSNLLAGTLPAHRKNIIRALKREPLSGNKVRAFAANLKGDLEQVTIDVWVQRWYNQRGIGGLGTLTKIRYEWLAQYIREQAADEGYKPAEYQAIIWCKTIEAAGRKPKSFLTVPDRGQQYFEFYWMRD